MVIVIGFGRRQIATYEQYILDKLRVCYEAIKYFQDRLFISHTAELWYDAPTEALGGFFQGEVPAQNNYNALQILEIKLKNLTFQELRRTIIIFRGVWTMDKNELTGYFSLHNPKDWRDVYGDLEISAYENDLADAFLVRGDAEEIISDFVNTLNRNISNLRVLVNQIVFCKGLWNKHEPENLRVIYMSNEMRGLLKLFYDARRKEKNWDMEIFAKPLDTNFFMETLEKTAIVQERFDKELEQDNTIAVPVGSKLYIGKNPDSFKKLYKDITETIIKPALSLLPTAASVKDHIEQGLRKYAD